MGRDAWTAQKRTRISTAGLTYLRVIKNLARPGDGDKRPDDASNSPRFHRRGFSLASSHPRFSETFSFLGFTYICGRSRRGYFQLQRKTRRDRLQWTALRRQALPNPRRLWYPYAPLFAPRVRRLDNGDHRIGPARWIERCGRVPQLIRVHRREIRLVPECAFCPA